MYDLIDGLVPKCKAYLFANAFHLPEGDVATIRARLAEDATAIWIYGPGWVGSDVKSVTGIGVRGDEGKLGSRGVGLLEGEVWGCDFVVSPRLVVEEEGAETLATYGDDGLPSAAALGRDVLLCDWGPSHSVLRKLLERAGCHVRTRGGEVVQTDGRFLAVHSGPGGAVEIDVPEGVTLEGDTATAFGAGETRWFTITRDG